jgi:hypothetical protein
MEALEDVAEGPPGAKVDRYMSAGGSEVTSRI